MTQLFPKQFCDLAKVTEGSGQDSGLDPSASLPAQQPVNAWTLALPSKGDFVEMHFVHLKWSVLVILVTWMRPLSATTKGRDPTWQWHLVFSLCQALFLALHVITAPLILMAVLWNWYCYHPYILSEKRRHTEVTWLARGSQGWSQDANPCS